MENNNVAEEQVKNTEAEGEQVKIIDEETVTLKKSEVDSMLEAAESAAKIAESKTKAAEDLTRGIDKYKKLLKEAGLEEEEPQQQTSKEEIAQMIRDAVKEVIPTIVPQKVENDEAAILKNQISEMRLAMANTKKSFSATAGSNADKDSVAGKTEAEKYFSEEQKAEIRRKFPNADLETIYKNMPKGDDIRGNTNA